MESRPAHRLVTERVALAPFDYGDVRALHALLADEASHLARFLPWASEEPRTLHEHLDLVRGFRRRFDADEEWTYALRHAGELVGSVALRPVAGEENAATVGYWIAERTEGRGLAFEAAAAVVRAAFELGGFTRLEIHCDASNEKSRALAERLGFRLDALLRERGHAPGEARAVHSLLAPEFAASPAARVAVRAEDALGDLLLPRPAARSAGFR